MLDLRILRRFGVSSMNEGPGAVRSGTADAGESLASSENWKGAPPPDLDLIRLQYTRISSAEQFVYGQGSEEQAEALIGG